MSSSNDIIEFPSTDREWMSRAKRNKLESASIHHTVCASASKISEAQYLLLRSFWVRVPLVKGKPEDWGINTVREASRWLDNEGDWQKYLQSLDSSSTTTPVPRLGSFSYVSLARCQVTRLPEEYDEEEEDKNVSFSPIAGRLRSSDNKYPPYGRTTPDSPSEAIARKRGIYQAPPSLSSDDGIDNDNSKGKAKGKSNASGDLTEVFGKINLREGSVHDSVQSSSSESKVVSSFEMSPNSFRRAFPKVEDEQIVNGFLIAFLATLCMHNPDVKLEWSPVRKAFKFGKVENPSSGEKAFLFEARTDGHLSQPASKKTNVRSAMIVEVKPTLRAYSNRVIYQATAQMAAWIYEEPDERDSPKPYRRAMILQERHEVRLVIAKYGQDYVDYLHDEAATGSDVSLLEMLEVRVWDIEKRRDMQEFGAILLALALQNGKLRY
ncbi:hypothetical protein FQN49_007739 [Arthroderma sp. PD_2]|nr:hypothetical protein FQN49_007739 [Arthroderma sp. PD_2]